MTIHSHYYYILIFKSVCVIKIDILYGSHGNGRQQSLYKFLLVKLNTSIAGC